MSTYIDDSWAVRAYKSGGALAQEPVFDPHHVLLGYTFSDAHHERHLCIDSLNDCCCSERRGDINDTGICPCAVFCLKREISANVMCIRQMGNFQNECEVVNTSLTELKTGRPM